MSLSRRRFDRVFAYTAQVNEACESDQSPCPHGKYFAHLTTPIPRGTFGFSETLPDDYTFLDSHGDVRAGVCGMRWRHEPRGWRARRAPVGGTFQFQIFRA